MNQLLSFSCISSLLTKGRVGWSWEEILESVKSTMDNPSKKDLEALRNSLNSYLGLMKHYRTYNIRKKALLSSGIPSILKYGYIETVPHKKMKYCLKQLTMDK